MQRKVVSIRSSYSEELVSFKYKRSEKNVRSQPEAEHGEKTKVDFVDINEFRKGYRPVDQTCSIFT